MGFTDPALVRQVARDVPGSSWYIFGEPNRHFGITGARFAPVFKYYRDLIKSMDSTARIVSPSLLNWDFTCVGCGGYQSGSAWAVDFVSRYETLYGNKPPIDVWAIDTYPIDWINTPNNSPGKKAFYDNQQLLHWQIAVAQVENLRAFLDVNGYSGVPIWITEISIHVGYDGWVWQDDRVAPVGIYHWELLGSYIGSVFDWLDQNSASLIIDKWFFFVTWTDIVNIGTGGYMGPILFESPQIGSDLTCLGEIFRARSLQEAPVVCDLAGNTVAR